MIDEGRRFYCAWLVPMAHENWGNCRTRAVLRHKDDQGLAEWKTRQWTQFCGRTPIISDVHESACAAARDLAANPHAFAVGLAVYEDQPPAIQLAPLEQVVDMTRRRQRSEMFSMLWLARPPEGCEFWVPCDLSDRAVLLGIDKAGTWNRDAVIDLALMGDWRGFRD